MAIRDGRILICDRCGRIAFEDLMCEDAHLIRERGWKYGYMHPDGKTLCPFCNALFKQGKLDEFKVEDGFGGD